MKQVYVCEKCGKMSDNYDEIQDCENRHWTGCRGYCGIDGLNDTLDSMSEYKEGQEEPNIVHLVFSRSYWNGDEWKDEKRCGKYKLISSYEMPLVIEDK